MSRDTLCVLLTLFNLRRPYFPQKEKDKMMIMMNLGRVEGIAFHADSLWVRHGGRLRDKLRASA